MPGTELLKNLSAKQRLALSMRFYDGLLVEQIAARMGTDKSTVSRIIDRGVEQLERNGVSTAPMFERLYAMPAAG